MHLWHFVCTQHVSVSDPHKVIVGSFVFIDYPIKPSYYVLKYGAATRNIYAVNHYVYAVSHCVFTEYLHCEE